MATALSATAGFLVEDFLEAITAQLDRTQDALRLKSVNRPLTYAIRDFSLELKVFVEMGADGRVRFRASGPNEDGASVVQVGFTTVTRPMIEESTVSLSAVGSPTLDELGLDETERNSLERLGVRNASQLVHLRRATGERTVARFSGLPVDRLRAALQQGRPSVVSVRPAPPPVVPPPAAGASPVPPEVQHGSAPAPAGPPHPPTIRVPVGTRRLHVAGHLPPDQVAGVRLGHRDLPVRAVADGLEVDLGDRADDGVLEVDLGDEGVVALALEFGPAAGPAADAAATTADAPHGDPGPDGDDPWRPT